MVAKVTKASDISGEDNADFGAVIREYPGLESARLLDLTKAEAEAIIAAAVQDVIPVEIRNPDTSSRTVLLTKAALDKLLGKEPDKVLKNASHLKGRRPGFSPNGG